MMEGLRKGEVVEVEMQVELLAITFSRYTYEISSAQEEPTSSSVLQSTVSRRKALLV